MQTLSNQVANIHKGDIPGQSSHWR